MLLQTPKFWYEKNHWLSVILWPLSILYQIISTSILFFKKPQKVNLPIICIGNAVMGGSGKTPTVQSIITILQQQGFNAHILLRGYRSAIREVHQVNPDQDTSQTVGDEAMLMSAFAPTWISQNRYVGALACQQAGADLIILDDGLQNHSIHRDINILVVNSMQQFGNGFIFPAGPLREPIAGLIKRCHGVVLIDDKNKNVDSIQFGHLQIWHATTDPDVTTINNLKSKKIYAFSGLGFNDKFFKMLSDEKLNVIKTVPYPDHYHYLHQDLHKMYIESQAISATLVTTSKDWQRLDDDWKSKITHIPIVLDIHNVDSLIELIKTPLKTL